MTTQIQDLASVSIQLAQPIFSGDAFGIPMIVSDHEHPSDLVQTFTNTADMLTAGFATTDIAYKRAVTMMAQTSKLGKKLASFKVGKSNSAAVSSTWSITFNADASAGTFTITAGGVTTAAIAYNANAAAIKTAIDDLAGLGVVTVTFNTGATQAGDKEGFKIAFNVTDGDVQVTAVNIGSLTGVTTATKTQTKDGNTTALNAAAAYAAIKAYDNDFFVYTISSANYFDGGDALNDQASALAVAIEADNRLLFISTNEADTIANVATDTASLIEALALTKTSVFYSSDTTYDLAAAVIGACMPDEIYSIMPCNYPLTSITPDTLTSTQIGYLYAKKCSWCESIGGYTIVPSSTAGINGRATGFTGYGYNIESIAAKLYLTEKFNNALYMLYINNTKLGFNADDFKVIENTLKYIAKVNGIDKDIIVDGTVVITMPDLATYDSAKKAVGLLDGITGSGTENKAIAKISVAFKLNV